MCDDRRIKFICSEKATKFEEIILLVLTLLNVVKTKGKSSSNQMAEKNCKHRLGIERSCFE